MWLLGRNYVLESPELFQNQNSLLHNFEMLHCYICLKVMSTPHRFTKSNLNYTIINCLWNLLLHLSFSQSIPRSTFIATMFSGVIIAGIIPAFSRISCLFSSSNDVINLRSGLQELFRRVHLCFLIAPSRICFFWTNFFEIHYHFGSLSEAYRLKSKVF